MKQIIAVVIIFSFILIACHRKAVPNVTERTELPPAPVKVVIPDSVSINLAAGKLIYETKCIKCHEAKPVANWNADQWKPILRSMIRKTRLDAAGASQVTAYVMENAKK